MSNQDAMKQYDIKKYRTPDGYTSDIAVFTLVPESIEEYKRPKLELKLMLIKRSASDSEGRINIEANKWALPGGFVNENESAYEAAKRELEEETGISGIHVKHYGVYDKPGRDPRGWIISNAHYAIVPDHYLSQRQANDDAVEVELFSLDEVFKLDLAFDHRDIIKDGIEIITSDLLQTSIAKEFLPEKFTYSELQAVLMTVTDDATITIDQSFSRKIKTLPYIEKVEGETTQRTSKFPAQLYRYIDIDITTNRYTQRY